MNVSADGRRLAGVVPALEGADQRRGAKPVRTAIPAQRLHLIHGSASRPRARAPSMDVDADAGDRRSPPIATLRAGDEVDGVFACTRKDRLTARTGAPYLALELRDRSGRDRRPRVPRRRRARAGASSAATSCACAGRVERFRDELQVEVRAIERAEDGRPGRVPAGRLPQPRRARRLPRAPRARGPRPGLPRRCWSALLADERAARRVAARAVHARAATTPTSAGCSSTPSRSATLALETCQLHPRLNPTCCSAPRSCTTSARRASSPTARRSG